MNKAIDKVVFSNNMTGFLHSTVGKKTGVKLDQ